MVSVNVAAIKDKVQGAIRDLGVPLTLRTIISDGAFDENTGVYTGRTYTDRTMSGVVSGRERRFMNGTLVQDDDFVVYIYDDGSNAPTLDEKLLLNGKEVSLQRVDEYALKNVNLAYRVVLAR